MAAKRITEPCCEQNLKAPSQSETRTVLWEMYLHTLREWLTGHTHQPRLQSAPEKKRKKSMPVGMFGRPWIDCECPLISSCTMLQTCHTLTLAIYSSKLDTAVASPAATQVKK